MPQYENGKRFAEELNTAFESLFVKSLDAMSNKSGSEKEFARSLEKKFMSEQALWLDSTHSSLGEKSFTDYLNGLEGDVLVLFLKGMAETSDFPFPESVFERVRQASPDEKRQFFEIIEEISPNEEQIKEAQVGQIFIVNQFLPLLAEYKDEADIQRVLNWFLSADKVDERIAEGISEYIKKTGILALPSVMARVESEIEAGTAELNGTDYLLQALTFLAKQDEESRDAFYPTLRRAFKDFNNKQIPSICLGDLGTVRAIPLLRTYIEKEEKTITRELYYEIISAIQRLGGSTNDLPDPFRDFSGSSPDIRYLFGLED